MNEAYIPIYKTFTLKKKTTEISVNDVTIWRQSLEAGAFSTHKIQAARMEQWQ